MRYSVLTSILISFFTLSTFANEPSDYNEAMRMAVKFFGGQRCGNTHNWLLKENDAITVDKTCHLLDSYKGHDLSGGWHDCGDHIKVAHTMGYAAVCMLTSYDIWPKAFEDHHSQTYGEANGIPDVLDEVKVATDFFMKSLVNGEFVFYVGRGGKDHTRWITSALQSTLGEENGGNPRECTATSTGGGWQAMNYASSLALMSLYYPNKDYADQCLVAAKELYEYALTHRPIDGVYCDGFYGPGNSNIKDEYALAGAIMYKVTGEEKYKTNAINEINGLWESNSPLAWDTVADIMYYYITVMDPTVTNGSGSWGSMFAFLEKNTGKIMDNANEYGIPWNWFSSKWGTNKLASGCAFSLALYAKLIDDGIVKPENDKSAQALAQNEKIVNYMLGDNEFKHPFIHGFKGDMYCRIHHRNAMGRDDNPPSEIKNTAPFKFASGGLIGGPTAEGSFSNMIEDADLFMETEGGCDYNAPFIGALANVVASKTPHSTPVDIYQQTNHNESIMLQVYPNPIKEEMSINILSSTEPVTKALVYNMNGQTVKRFNTNDLSNSKTVTWNTNELTPGTYLLQVSTKNQMITKKLVFIK